MILWSGRKNKIHQWGALDAVVPSVLPQTPDRDEPGQDNVRGKPPPTQGEATSHIGVVSAPVNWLTSIKPQWRFLPFMWCDMDNVSSPHPTVVMLGRLCIQHLVDKFFRFASQQEPNTQEALQTPPLWTTLYEHASTEPLASASEITAEPNYFIMGNFLCSSIKASYTVR